MVKTASFYLKRGILEKIFLAWGVKMEKNSTFYIKRRGRLNFKGNRFPPIWAHAHMYAAWNGVPQLTLNDWKIASRVSRTKGGSVKKWVNLTLTLNCAEMVRPSDMMPDTENMRLCICRSMVKTASFHLKSWILEKIFFVTEVRGKSIFAVKPALAKQRNPQNRLLRQAVS